MDQRGDVIGCELIGHRDHRNGCVSVVLRHLRDELFSADLFQHDVGEDDVGIETVVQDLERSGSVGCGENTPAFLSQDSLDDIADRELVVDNECPRRRSNARNFRGSSASRQPNGETRCPRKFCVCNNSGFAANFSRTALRRTRRDVFSFRRSTSSDCRSGPSGSPCSTCTGSRTRPSTDRSRNCSSRDRTTPEYRYET